MKAVSKLTESEIQRVFVILPDGTNNRYTMWEGKKFCDVLKEIENQPTMNRYITDIQLQENIYSVKAIPEDMSTGGEWLFTLLI